jgi:hypothetical protein
VGRSAAQAQNQAFELKAQLISSSRKNLTEKIDFYAFLLCLTTLV